MLYLFPQSGNGVKYKFVATTSDSPVTREARERYHGDEVHRRNLTFPEGCGFLNTYTSLKTRQNRQN